MYNNLENRKINSGCIPLHFSYFRTILNNRKITDNNLKNSHV
jgi:hypothetical protein